jgi:hypothetical protein
MPSSATITGYNTFTGRTRAKATEVNANFQNHRGHNVPINTDTATASDNTHDLGASDHRWREAYLGNFPKVNGNAFRMNISAVFDGTVPCDIVSPIGQLGRVAFPTSRDTDVRFDFMVPSAFTPGNRVGLVLQGYPETTGSTVFQATARLHKSASTNITASSTPAASVTNTLTMANAVAGLFTEDATLKLTDSSGLINGITVTVGDVISVGIKRSAVSATGDTNTGYWFMTGLQIDFDN